MASSPAANGIFELATNLAELPYGLFAHLAIQLNDEEFWRALFGDSDRNSAYHLSPEESERCRRMNDPGSHLLRLLGNRGQTVKGFLARLHSLAKLFGPKMDVPQLILHRRFCPLIWSRAEQVLISIEGDRLRLQCKASGFPTPHYQWLEEERPVEGADQASLIILRCHCTARNVFRCRVWNAVEDGHEWSSFYRSAGKRFHSELLSDVIDLQQFVLDGPSKRCEKCKKEEMEELCRMLEGQSTGDGQGQRVEAGQDGVGTSASVEDADVVQMMTTQAETLVAADKVALIVSNRTYAPEMGNLITPHCDAETLADALQQLGFKTVTLGDLNMAEMRKMIQEYRNLLGEGVYAVFYFVGHGFEANGQCYLLPIGAPGQDYGPDHCLSMDWVMDQFRDFRPALNLILLDICRKFLPSNLDAFTVYAERFRKGDVRVNRNTVYGYATSGGVGAYEVKGEQNGVFMKYLKRRIQQPMSLLDMLNKVFRDVEKDPKVCDVQIPELRSNLTRPRSLRDPLVYDGHTTSYDHHTYHWRTMHELPMPVNVEFAELQLQVTIWFDFCGHFTNKVYVFSSMGDLLGASDDEGQNNSVDIISTLPSNGCSTAADAETAGRRRGQRSSSGTKTPSQWARAHLAHLKFPEKFESSAPKLCEDDEEGISLCVLLSHLQRANNELSCTVEVREAENDANLVAKREIQSLGHVLITKLRATAGSSN